MSGFIEISKLVGWAANSAACGIASIPANQLHEHMNVDYITEYLSRDSCIFRHMYYVASCELRYIVN
jgi:hypothetical protein